MASGEDGCRLQRKALPGDKLSSRGVPMLEIELLGEDPVLLDAVEADPLSAWRMGRPTLRRLGIHQPE